MDFRFCKSSDDTKKAKVSQILERLINLTIEQKEMYPSIQAKIWGSIGQVSFNSLKSFEYFGKQINEPFDCRFRN